MGMGRRAGRPPRRGRPPGPRPARLAVCGCGRAPSRPAAGAPARPPGPPPGAAPTCMPRPSAAQSQPTPPPPLRRTPLPCQQHKLYVGGKNLGKGVVALPQKLGGGVTLTDLETGRSLSSLWWAAARAGAARRAGLSLGPLAGARPRACQLLPLGGARRPSRPSPPPTHPPPTDIPPPTPTKVLQLW
jgi:hypothetical protein